LEIAAGARGVERRLLGVLFGRVERRHVARGRVGPERFGREQLDRPALLLRSVASRVDGGRVAAVVFEGVGLLGLRPLLSKSRHDGSRSRAAASTLASECTSALGSTARVLVGSSS